MGNNIATGGNHLLTFEFDKVTGNYLFIQKDVKVDYLGTEAKEISKAVEKILDSDAESNDGTATFSVGKIDYSVDSIASVFVVTKTGSDESITMGHKHAIDLIRMTETLY